MTDFKRFFEGYRREFGNLTQLQVDGLNFLLRSFDADPSWADKRHRAYALATIRHETGISVKRDGQMVSLMYQPIEEVGGRLYLSKYFLKPSLRHALGNIQLSDAWNYKGRGYVQITGRANYRKFGIENNPEKALEPETAFKIMTKGMFRGMFTGKKLSDYINDETTLYVEARRIINRLDRAADIARYAVKFQGIL